MPELLEVIENLGSAERDVRSIFTSEDGTRVKESARRFGPANLLLAERLIKEVERGKRPTSHLKEAMSTDDFPILFADILDRQMLGFYKEMDPVWQAFIKRDVVNDFRPVKRYAQDGLEGQLPEVEQLEEYPEDSLSESADEYSVKKYGKRVALSWETWINDDFSNFLRIPERLARAARRTEQRFATGLYVGEKGPNETLYKSEYANQITGNPVLSIQGLQKGIETLANQKDEDDEPIVNEAVVLVVPPALEITALNIVNAITIDVNELGGSEKARLRVDNWMKNRVRVVVDPYIPIVASKENGGTSWFLFADPNVGRPALIMGFLRGYEEPSLYEKIPTARRIGGGEVSESFEIDDRQWRVRHVMGGARLLETGGAKATAASSGKGS